jgi:hypothetical protein
MKRFTKMLFAACGTVGLTAGAAVAVPVQVGETVNLNGTASFQENWLSGTAETVTQEFPFTVTDSNGAPVFQGTFTARVVRSSVTQTVRIEYRIQDMQAIGNRAVESVAIGAFIGMTTNADYSFDTPGDVGPDSVTRTSAFMIFDFDPLLFASQDSYGFWVHTNAAHFNTRGGARITLNTGEFAVIQTGIFRPSKVDCPGDANGDNAVNFSDLNIVLSNFGEECD